MTITQKTVSENKGVHLQRHADWAESAICFPPELLAAE